MSVKKSIACPSCNMIRIYGDLNKIVRVRLPLTGLPRTKLRAWHCENCGQTFQERLEVLHDLRRIGLI